MNYRSTTLSTLALLAVLASPLAAQDTTETPSPSAEATEPETSGEALLSQAELEELTAPVALYPDTLLVQLLVAATYPLQVIKAEQAVEKAADLDEAARKEALEAEGFDPSVEVLAVAFPTVLQQMAENIEWTEELGNAMLAQSDDVMSTIQLLRTQAIETGALIDTEEQEVTVEETLSTSGDPTETVIIQPTDPETVYVPQYDPVAVYDTSSSTDLWAAGLMGFATYALIDAIFNDDDDWYDYWGCGSCGGWNGGPIINDPSIDIDWDGDINIERPDRPEGWQPDPERRDEARDKIAENRGPVSTQPLPGQADRGDALREQLSQQAGTADISRPENADALRDAAVAAGVAGGAVAGREALKRSSDRGNVKVNRPENMQKPANRPAVSKPATKPKVDRPANRQQVNRPSTSHKVQRPTGGHSKPAVKKHAGGNRAKAASKRGHAGKAKRR